MNTRKLIRPTHRRRVLEPPTAILRWDATLIAIFGLLGLLASPRGAEQMPSR